MSPFEAVYDHAPPTLLSYVPGMTHVDSVEQELKILGSDLEEAKGAFASCSTADEKIL